MHKVVQVLFLLPPIALCNATVYPTRQDADTLHANPPTMALRDSWSSRRLVSVYHAFPRGARVYRYREVEGNTLD